MYRLIAALSDRRARARLGLSVAGVALALVSVALAWTAVACAVAAALRFAALLVGDPPAARFVADLLAVAVVLVGGFVARTGALVALSAATAAGARHHALGAGDPGRPG